MSSYRALVWKWEREREKEREGIEEEGKEMEKVCSIVRLFDQDECTIK